MARSAPAYHPETGRETNAESEKPSDRLPAPKSTPGQSRIRPGEFTRKALHMTPGLFPFLLAMVDHPDPLQWNEVWFIAQICIVFTVGFLALYRIVKRPDEKNLLSTTLSYPIIILSMLALFRAHAEFTCVVVAILAFGDGAAYFGGTLFGKRKLPWNPEKSWAGMISFVAVSAPIASLAYWVEARNPAAPILLAIICATTASLLAAIAETLRTQITDNLRVGVAASIGVVAAYYSCSSLFGV